MHFLRRLRSFNTDNTFVSMFYIFVNESVLTLSFISWCDILSLQNKNKIQSIIKVCTEITGTKLDKITDLYKARALAKAQRILADKFHPLFKEFHLLSSGCRFSLPKCNTNCHKSSFIPVVIALVNSSEPTPWMNIYLLNYYCDMYPCSTLYYFIIACFVCVLPWVLYKCGPLLQRNTHTHIICISSLKWGQNKLRADQVLSKSIQRPIDIN